MTSPWKEKNKTTKPGLSSALSLKLIVKPMVLVLMESYCRWVWREFRNSLENCCFESNVFVFLSWLSHKHSHKITQAQWHFTPFSNVFLLFILPDFVLWKQTQCWYSHYLCWYQYLLIESFICSIQLFPPEPQWSWVFYSHSVWYTFWWHSGVKEALCSINSMEQRWKC